MFSCLVKKSVCIVKKSHWSTTELVEILSLGLTRQSPLKRMRKKIERMDASAIHRENRVFYLKEASGSEEGDIS